MGVDRGVVCTAGKCTRDLVDTRLQKPYRGFQIIGGTPKLAPWSLKPTVT